MFDMCYVKQYSVSFNTVIDWLDIFWHLFQKYIIFFIIYIQENISWSRKLNKCFSCFRFDISKINLVLPLGFKVTNVKNLHSKKLKMLI